MNTWSESHFAAAAAAADVCERMCLLGRTVETVFHSHCRCTTQDDQIRSGDIDIDIDVEQLTVVQIIALCFLPPTSVVCLRLNGVFTF